MKLANRLWNVLVAIERARRARYIRIMRDAAQERIDELRSNASRLRDEIRARRKNARKRSIDITDLLAPLEEIKQEMTKLIAAQKSTASVRHDAKRAELAALQERTGQR